MIASLTDSPNIGLRSQPRPQALRRFKWVMISLILLSNTLSAWARPTQRVVSRDEGDASVTLTLESQYIEGDSLIPCEVTFSVAGERRPFEIGDTISMSVREDDLIGDDTLWEQEVIVDAAIENVQNFTMTYDCSFAALGDALGSIEVYAKLDVDKADCGNICELSGGEDTPSTANIYMREVDDDDAEEKKALVSKP